jgi:hypothetical protein
MGIPQKFTNKTLKRLGLSSSTDQRLLGVLKFIGIIDQSGTPTLLWSEYRKSPRTALAKATRTAYSDLFIHFPDAHQRDAEALRTYFAATSSLGAVAVTQMVSTFRAICQLGDFAGLDQPVADDGATELEVEKPPPPATRRNAVTTSGGGELTVNINIQLQLPADATAETYDRFFEAMRKHLLTPAE